LIYLPFLQFVGGVAQEIVKKRRDERRCESRFTGTRGAGALPSKLAGDCAVGAGFWRE